MPAKDLGTKYTCFKCGAKFYDLKKPEPMCPKCGTDQREASLRSSDRAERKRVARAVEPIVEEETPEEEEELGLSEEEEDEVPEEDEDED